MQKIKKEIKLDDNIIYELEGPLDKAILYLQSLPDMYKGFSEFRLANTGCYDYDTVAVFGRRWETDEEFNKRKKRREASRKANKAKKEKKEAREKADYERLKKKYGD